MSGREVDDSSALEQRGDPNRKFRLIAGRRILFDSEGFLWNMEDWTEEIAKTLAAETGLHEMTATHWRIIRFMRDYFANQGRAPLNAHLKSGLGVSLMELERIFPGGIRRGARKIAGLPNPKSCTG